MRPPIRKSNGRRVHHSIEIGPKESPCLALRAGQDVSLDGALPCPSQERAGLDLEVCSRLTRGQPILIDIFH